MEVRLIPQSVFPGPRQRTFEGVNKESDGPWHQGNVIHTACHANKRLAKPNTPKGRVNGRVSMYQLTFH